MRTFFLALREHDARLQHPRDAEEEHFLVRPLENTADQRALLERAVTLAKPTGTIAYITCSVLDEENDAQIADFLARHSGFVTLDLRPAVAELGETAQERVRMTRTGGVLLTPLRSGTDGFFIALLERKR